MTDAKAGLTAKPIHKKGRERHGQILAAARERLIKLGVNGLVLRELAEEMGITHGNLQYYFKTKSDLLQALFDEEVEKYTGGLRESVRSAHTPAAKISAIVDSGFEQLTTEDTRLWRALISVAQDDPMFASILKQQNEYYDQVLAEELRTIVPRMKPQRRGHIAKMIRIMLDGASVDFIYSDPRAPEVTALKAEIKSLLSSLVSGA